MEELALILKDVKVYIETQGANNFLHDLRYMYPDIHDSLLRAVDIDKKTAALFKVRKDVGTG